MALLKLDGKNVVVTGVSGIGGAFAQICADQGAGKVFAVDRDEKAFAGFDFKKSPNIVKVLCDVGTKEGPEKLAAAVGDAPVHMVFLAAACPKNIDGMGARFTNIGYDDLDDMIRTDCHGKLFVVQRLAKNLQTVAELEARKPRVFSIGAPFSEGPMPTGKYMVIPGWAGFGVAKAACTWVHEGMKAEMSGMATFGYGHPGFTKTPLIDEVVAGFSKDHLLSKMCGKRFADKDYHEPTEPAKMFYSVMTDTDDAEYAGTKWNVVAMYKKFGEKLGVKATSDVKKGIKIPDSK